MIFFLNESELNKQKCSVTMNICILQECQYHSALGFHLNINSLEVFMSCAKTEKREPKSNSTKKVPMMVKKSKVEAPDFETRLGVEFGGSKKKMVSIKIGFMSLCSLLVF